MKGLQEAVAELHTKDLEHFRKQLLDIPGEVGDFLRACVADDAQTAASFLDMEPAAATVEVRSLTPLRLAMEAGAVNVTKLLIERGADIHVQDKGFQQTPLFLAAESGQAAIVSLLIAHGAKVDAKDINHETPLFYAARSGRSAEAIQELLAAGADLEARGKNDQTPLQAAIYASEWSTVTRTLIAAGANVNAPAAKSSDSWGESEEYWPIVQDPRGARPLYIAVFTGSTELVERLLDAGADINALSFGWTALHAAAAKPLPEMVKLLLRRGADIRALSHNGRDPIAMFDGYRRTGELLRAAMLSKRQ